MYRSTRFLFSKIIFLAVTYFFPSILTTTLADPIPATSYWMHGANLPGANEFDSAGAACTQGTDIFYGK